MFSKQIIFPNAFDSGWFKFVSVQGSMSSVSLSAIFIEISFIFAIFETSKLI